MLVEGGILVRRRRTRRKKNSLHLSYLVLLDTYPLLHPPRAFCVLCIWCGYLVFSIEYLHCMLNPQSNSSHTTRAATTAASSNSQQVEDNYACSHLFWLWTSPPTTSVYSHSDYHHPCLWASSRRTSSSQESSMQMLWRSQGGEERRNTAGRRTRWRSWGKGAIHERDSRWAGLSYICVQNQWLPRLVLQPW